MPTKEETVTDPSKRRPWIAALLALSMVGLGHLYVGKVGRAIAIWLFAALALPLMWIAGFSLLAKPLHILLLVIFSVAIVAVIVCDATRIARRSPLDYELKWWNRWYVYVLVFLVVGVGTREMHIACVIEAYRVPSGSMENTLLPGDYFLGDKFTYGARFPLIGVVFPGLRDPVPGDVAVFRVPGSEEVKKVDRCVAVGGQIIEIREGNLLVDGRPEELAPGIKYTGRKGGPDASRDPRYVFGPFRVPKGQYFFMGDNRDNSWDSRFFGPVRRENILARAWIVHFSRGPSDDGPIRIRWERIGQMIE